MCTESVQDENNVERNSLVDVVSLPNHSITLAIRSRSRESKQPRPFIMTNDFFTSAVTISYYIYFLHEGEDEDVEEEELRDGGGTRGRVKLVAF